MSYPPETIQIKRKRGADDGPVDFLQVEGAKRSRSSSGDAIWVYQRAGTVKRAPSVPDRPVSIPEIRATKEGDERRPIKSLRRPTTRNDNSPAPKPVEGVTPAVLISDDLTNRKIRRFHLSKPDSSELTATQSIKRKRGAPALFVERSTKKQREHGYTEPKSPAPVKEQLTTTPNQPAITTATQQETKTATSVLKRPGVHARTKSSKPALPPSLVNRSAETTMDELARDMAAYTLAQISSDLTKMDAANRPKTKLRYKPKAPVARWAERHPEYVAEQERAKTIAVDSVMHDIDSSTDEEDYVVETYERVPASRLRDQVVPPDRVGLLVFDTEPDRIDFFFGNEEESEDELLDDDEDENAENYYTADYPDEDLDWDDQFDRNPYQYAHGDVDDFSGDEDDGNSEFGDDHWERIEKMKDAVS
ncbi:hypothetical protein OQA88_339 [Cercophora sp. LCS_1]